LISLLLIFYKYFLNCILSFLSLTDRQQTVTHKDSIVFACGFNHTTQSCQLISISYYSKHSITDLSLITIQIKTRCNYSIRNIVGAHCRISGNEALQTETPPRYSNSKLIPWLNTIYVWVREWGRGLV